MLIYKLDPIQAYDLGLVKKIEVDSTAIEQGGNGAFVELVEIKSGANSLTVKLKIDVNGKNGVERKTLSAKVNLSSRNKSGTADLYKLSNGREAYKDGYFIDSVNLENQTLKFSNGRIIRKGEQIGGLNEILMRAQMQNTISKHLEKQKMLKERGIKVLSLFFIDSVSNYRDFDETTGQPKKGKFALWFEEDFARFAEKPEYRDLIHFDVAKLHDGYFSIDKKNIHSPFEDVSLKSNASEADAQSSSFNLIMRDKERLLSEDEPLRFIFSHSALKEGWDNPNVFQICTLTETNSEISKRQKIGRGLRLPVDKDGKQVADGGTAVLTVFASESFADFAKDLQRELSEDCGVVFGTRLKNAKDTRKLKPREKLIEDEKFIELWKRISSATRYRVEFETGKLIEEAAKTMENLDIQPIRLARDVNGLMMRRGEGVGGVLKTMERSGIYFVPEWIPNLLGEIQAGTGLTRNTIFEILQRAEKLKEISKNPSSFIDQATETINSVLLELMVENIKYEKVESPVPEWDMRAFAIEELSEYLDSLEPVENLEKTVYQAVEDSKSYVQIDHSSKPEKSFARDLDSLQNVKFYMKLPRKFKIATPLGNYTPDWAVVFENDRRIYFVAETKSQGQELRRSEEMKIKCGKRHFEAIREDCNGALYYGPVSGINEIVANLPG